MILLYKYDANIFLIKSPTVMNLVYIDIKYE